MKRAAAMILMALIVCTGALKAARADTDGFYVICTPNGEVNVRKHAKTKSDEVGALSFGTKVLADGKVKNGFTHVYDLAGEYTTGWVSNGYLVEDEPIVREVVGYIVSNGRVAARKCINGKRKAWLMPGSEVIVFVISKEWCVTEYGFIRTEFIEIPEQEGCY